MKITRTLRTIATLTLTIFTSTTIANSAPSMPRNVGSPTRDLAPSPYCQSPLVKTEAGFGMLERRGKLIYYIPGKNDHPMLKSKQIIVESSKDDTVFLNNHNANAILLRDGKYLIRNKIIDVHNDFINDTAISSLTSTIIHEDIEALMQILRFNNNKKDRKTSYQGIKELILNNKEVVQAYKKMVPNHVEAPDLMLNDLIACAFELLHVDEINKKRRAEGESLPQNVETRLRRVSFINAIRPIIDENRHNYFTELFWNWKVRDDLLRVAFVDGGFENAGSESHPCYMGFACHHSCPSYETCEGASDFKYEREKKEEEEKERRLSSSSSSSSSSWDDDYASPSEKEREKAINRISFLKDVGEILKYLDSSNQWLVRKAAAGALVEIGDPRGLIAIIANLLGDLEGESDINVFKEQHPIFFSFKDKIALQFATNLGLKTTGLVVVALGITTYLTLGFSILTMAIILAVVTIAVPSLTYGIKYLFKRSYQKAVKNMDFSDIEELNHEVAEGLEAKKIAEKEAARKAEEAKLKVKLKAKQEAEFNKAHDEARKMDAQITAEKEASRKAEEEKAQKAIEAQSQNIKRRATGGSLQRNVETRRRRVSFINENQKQTSNRNDNNYKFDSPKIDLSPENIASKLPTSTALKLKIAVQYYKSGKTKVLKRIFAGLVLTMKGINNSAKEQAAVFAISYVKAALGKVDYQQLKTYVTSNPLKKITLDKNHTFAMIKPDGYAKRVEIVEAIKKAGFEVEFSVVKKMTTEEAEVFYAEHKGKPFFHLLVEYMTSGPVVQLFLKKPNDIQAAWALFRKLAGKTDGTEKGSLREVFGTEIIQKENGLKIVKNKIHCSDSFESVVREASLINELEVQTSGQDVDTENSFFKIKPSDEIIASADSEEVKQSFDAAKKSVLKGLNNLADLEHIKNAQLQGDLETMGEFSHENGIRVSPVAARQSINVMGEKRYLVLEATLLHEYVHASLVDSKYSLQEREAIAGAVEMRYLYSEAYLIEKELNALNANFIYGTVFNGVIQFLRDKENKNAINAPLVNMLSRFSTVSADVLESQLFQLLRLFALDTGDLMDFDFSKVLVLAKVELELEDEIFIAGPLDSLVREAKHVALNQMTSDIRIQNHENKKKRAVLLDNPESIDSEMVLSLIKDKSRDLYVFRNGILSHYSIMYDKLVQETGVRVGSLSNAVDCISQFDMEVRVVSGNREDLVTIKPERAMLFSTHLAEKRASEINLKNLPMEMLILPMVFSFDAVKVNQYKGVGKVFTKHGKLFELNLEYVSLFGESMKEAFANVMNKIRNGVVENIKLRIVKQAA